MERKIILFSLIIIFLFISLTSSSSYILQKKEIIDNTVDRDFGELHFMFDLEAQTGDYQIFGCEYDKSYFYITGGNNGIEPNKVYKFDSNGNYVSSFDQAGTTGWGWVDLACDGQYLYGGRDGGIIDVFTTDGTIIDHIPAPVPWPVGLAYDPDTDHLWTTDRYEDTNFYEIDKNGNIINVLTNTKLVYGLAYDGISDERYLWCSVFEEGGSECTFYQYSIDCQAYTCASFPAADPGNTSSNKACGLGFTTKWNASAGICLLFGIQQCDQLPDGPGDILAGYEIMLICPPAPMICCSGNFSWNNIVAGSTVNGVFYVKNCGADGSELDWQVESYPDWGTNWSFNPASGTGLTVWAGWQTVIVNFTAPTEKKKEFMGTIKLIDLNNPYIFCEIPVYLQTPRNKQYINSPLLNILENHPNKIIILQKILQRIRPL